MYVNSTFHLSRLESWSELEWPSLWSCKLKYQLHFLQIEVVGFCRWSDITSETKQHLSNFEYMVYFYQDERIWKDLTLGLKTCR